MDERAVLNAANKKRFLELLESVEREGMKDLIKFINKTDFFEAPASTRFHGAYSGGLLEHSLNVYDEFIRILEAFPEIKCTPENAIIAALLHDLCKANLYTTQRRNRKNEETGKWESYDAYVTDEKFCYGGHGSKSVYLASYYIRLQPIEAVAIQNHMGVYGLVNGYQVSDAYEAEPFAWALHVADEAATFLLESEKRKGG